MADPTSGDAMEQALRQRQSKPAARQATDDRAQVARALEAGGWQREADRGGVWVFTKATTPMVVLLGTASKAWLEVNGCRRSLPPKARARILSWGNDLP